MPDKHKRAEALAALLREAARPDPTDVLGSWTGRPWDEEEEPVQDVDDL